MSVTLATSAALGVLAYVRFMSSDRYLVRAAVEMRSRGAALSPAQCVQTVLGWLGQCQAMKSLCDASVPRMMESCLAGADRHEYCVRLGESIHAAAFGARECASSELALRHHKQCGLCYRTIALHCAMQRRGRSP